MNLLDNVSLTNLKTIWFAGEVFPTKQFNYWKSKLGNTLFANLYGPIEITLDCTYFIVNREIPDDELYKFRFAHHKASCAIARIPFDSDTGDLLFKIRNDVVEMLEINPCPDCCYT